MLRPDSPPTLPATKATTGVVGLASALVAFLSWGFFPLFFTLIRHLDAWQILAYRAVWSLPFVLGIVLFSGRGKLLITLLRTKFWAVLGSAAMLALNWTGFVWLVVTGRFVEVSIAYYLTPMFMAGLGLVVLKESLRPMQAVALAVAMVGVVIMIVGSAAAPWISLVVALVWGLYSLIRRANRIPALEGLSVELGLFVLPALLWLTFTGFALTPKPGETAAPIDWIWIVLLGAVTIVPLIFYGFATTRLNLATIGVLQFIAPTMQFLTGVLVNDEPFDTVRPVAFAFLWIAVIFYGVDGWRNRRPPIAREVPA